jgi:predicted DNA-binding transcriptional regulator AlpA
MTMTRRHRWTVDAVRSLPVLVDLRTAADVLGLSLSRAYELIKAGTFPVQRIHVGGRSVVRLADLLMYLGLE